MTKKQKVKIRKYEGLPVVDADKSLLINITSADVKAARKFDPANCAAAMACKRVYKREVRIFRSRAYIKEKNHWVRYMVPQAVSREIISFDRGSQFEPGEYKVNPPSPTNQLGRYHTGKIGGPHNEKPKKPIHKTAHVREFDRLYLAERKDAKT